MYRTRLVEWKKELEAELRRRVTWREIAEETGLSYNTLQKHREHQYERPDYDVAKRISAWFNATSRTRLKTPLDYFVHTSEDATEGQYAGAIAV